MYPVLETITPERALEILEHGSGNPRKLRLNHVKEFTEVARDGNFKTSHHGIAFRCDGRLGDGQHRLWGIYDAGVTVKMWVWYDVPDDVFDEATDVLNLPRKVSDQIGVSPRRIGPATFICRAHHWTYSGKVTRKMVLPYWQAFSEATDQMLESCGSARQRFSTAPVRAAAVICMLDRDPEFTLHTYRSLMLTQTDQFKPSGHSFFRWVSNQRSLVGPIQWELFCKALQVFDPACQSFIKLNLRDLATAMKRAGSRIDAILARSQAAA